MNNVKISHVEVVSHLNADLYRHNKNSATKLNEALGVKVAVCNTLCSQPLCYRRLC